MTHNIDYQFDDTAGAVIPMHRGGYCRPIVGDPRLYTRDHDAAWHERVNASDAFAETFQREPCPLTFGERLVIHFNLWGDFYTGTLVGGIIVSLIICAAAQLLVRAGF
jgi:hypothetical protein